MEKGSFFETFIPDGKSVVVPVKDFQFIAALVVEDEEGWCKRIGLTGVPHDTDETVEGFSNVDGLTMKEDGNVGRQS